MATRLGSWAVRAARTDLSAESPGDDAPAPKRRRARRTRRRTRRVRFGSVANEAESVESAGSADSSESADDESMDSDSVEAEIRGVLVATFGRGFVKLRVRGGERTLEIRRLSSGGFNTVYALPALPRFVLRVSSTPLGADDRRAYHREIAVQRKLARLRLSPRVFAVVHAGGRVGVFMERFDATLEDVLRVRSHRQKVFGEHDGEGALIELMMRVSRVASCVDTKAANVVLRLAPVELAVIDLDPYFCRARKGRECAEFEQCVRSGSPASAVHAAVSLLILALEAAHSAPHSAPMFPRIVGALLGAWPVVERALRADERGNGAPVSAMQQIRHYTGIRTYAGVRRALSAMR
jgi:hypothetical protein